MASLSDLDDVDRRLVGLLDHLAVVLAETVVGVAALDDDAGRRHVGDVDRVVLAGDDRLGEVTTDLLAVDVERRDELHVTDVVAAEVDVHEAGDARLGVGVLVELDALDERRGAVADADDGDSNGTHRGGLLQLLNSALRRTMRCWTAAWYGPAGLRRPSRSVAMSSLSQRTSRSTDSRPWRCSSRV